MADVPPAIKDAATILVYRESPSLQLFMVKRHGRSAFMANAMVFPGGRLEDVDCDSAWFDRCEMRPATAAKELDHSDHTYALGLYVAAIRETFEEAGVLLASFDNALVSPNSESGRAILIDERAALNAEMTSFLEVVERHNLQLQTAALSYFTRWVTPAIETRRYDARFFIAKAPADQVPLHDKKETTASEWLAPDEALRKYEAGEIELAPPTLRILIELDRRPTLLTQPKGFTGTPIEPQPLKTDGEFHLILPGDPEYDPPGDEPNRIIRRDGKWLSIGQGA
jgi:8-oxo-dGTP pyrophosphatase MutT (NUDIX family)